jgi:hypothetical protein
MDARDFVAVKRGGPKLNKGNRGRVKLPAVLDGDDWRALTGLVTAISAIRKAASFVRRADMPCLLT